MNRRLRILVVSLEYPPFADGGYGVLCAQVCRRLQQHGHTLLVLTVDNPAAGSTNPPASVDGVSVRRTLCSYLDGAECLYPPFREALDIERAN
jgi:hypothetical protein